MDTQFNPTILTCIQDVITPRYSAFDPAHSIEHVNSVIKAALAMCCHYDVNPNMIAVAAECHDLGLNSDRKTHHLISGSIIRRDKSLPKWFTPEQIKTNAQAAEDHRASSGQEPRSIYSKIIAEADRQIDPDTVITRTVQYGFEHYPQLDREGHWRRMLQHLHEKYAEGGYLKLWIPESNT